LLFYNVHRGMFTFWSIVIVVIIMFVYSIDDIMRNLYISNIRHAWRHYIQKGKTAKLLPHTVHSG